MSKERKDKKEKGVSRRDFIRTTAATAGTVTIAGMGGIKAAEAANSSSASVPARSHPETQPQDSAKEHTFPRVDRQAILFAMGDTLIPSAPGDPGYRDLEYHGITEEINSRIEISDADLDTFNKSSAEGFGNAFAQLQEAQRAEYFNKIIQGGAVKDETRQVKLKEIYAHIREIVFTVYYQNFPQDRWPNDSLRVPFAAKGDEHQITNPNTPEVFTGWDRAGYGGPLTWGEEEKRRAYFKKIRWQE
jgi:hypothetical protein